MLLLIALACGLPRAGASGIVSDDFNTCALDTGLWTLVDPVGSASVQVAGMGTEDAHAVISIPAGPAHDAWTSHNHTVRLMQPASNTDFEVRVKFDSLLNAGYQMQGLLVEQDTGRFIRYDLVHNGSGTFLFAGTFSGGAAVVRATRAVANQAPFHLAVARLGHDWTLRYSYDAVNWTDLTTFHFAMDVARVGPFAGNWSATRAPAVVVKVDYVLNPQAPFLREDGPITEGATLITSVSGEGSVEVDPLLPVYPCAEAVSVRAVPAEGWRFEGWNGDLTGTVPAQMLSMAVSKNVQATFAPTALPALLIDDVNATPTQTSATIAWTTSAPATSRVLHGRTRSYESGEVRSDEFTMAHALELSGLAADTEYHYLIICTDQHGQSAATPDLTFRTLEEPAPTALTSDDFNAGALNLALWTIMNPSGQAGFRMVGTGSRDARLEIAVPAGVPHQAWIDGIHAPWVRQRLANVDFEAELRFDSALTRRWQAQGIIVQEDEDSFIRADFYSENDASRLYVGTFDNGAVREIRNIPVPSGPPYFLRLARAGDEWTLRYSKDRVNWQNGAAFHHVMSVTGAGPYIANPGDPAPEFVGLVDYFFNAASPIELEDGYPPEDLAAPKLLDVRTAAQQTSIEVSWATDEPATSLVQYGTTTGYELGNRGESGYHTQHAVSIGGLEPSTTYNLRIVSADPSGNTTRSDNFTVSTTGIPGGPGIDVWYGDTQEFGWIGQPTPAISILGNAAATSGLTLSYSLNGGSFVPLSKGPNAMRLALPGDFNVEIPFGSLQPGANAVRIRARDAAGRETIRPVSVINSRGAVWPNPYTIRWNDASSINSVAQVVDGQWSIGNGTVRPMVMAYDRLIAVGDTTWQDYEVTCPVTVHAIDPGGYAAPSYGPGVGLLLRWPGHANDGNQPWQGVYPLGAIGMFRWTRGYERFELFGNHGRILASSGDTLHLGVRYLFKMQVRTVSGGAQYQLKWWRADQAEPGTWQLTGAQPSADDPGRGCMLLLAHHVDASFGDVVITPLP